MVIVVIPGCRWSFLAVDGHLWLSMVILVIPGCRWSSLAVDGHLPQLVCRRRAIFSVRRAELHDAVRVVDVRRLPAQPRQSESIKSDQVKLY